MRWPLPLPLLGLAALALADGPGDNLPDKVRRIPPPGVKLPDADRAALAAGVAELARRIDALKARPEAAELLPDVLIYHKAVDWALRYDEFFDVKEVAAAKTLLGQGLERAKLLAEGKHPWTEQTGLVARGYVSAIDGSVQPYGLVVPDDYRPGDGTKRRLDLWCHGRNEKLSELNFVTAVQRSGGEFRPAGAFVLQLYGRYCNANKFAGEIDAFEAMASVKKRYPIDEDRVVIRGFSMGGAACWQFAAHYPDVWCAAAPGAGFSETADFLKVFQNEPVQPTWYEQKLWRWYDCTEYALNLFNLPTVAYSGEVDKQKQAADMMEKAMAAHGLTLKHVIGPKTGHKYEANAKAQINAFVDAAAAKGRDKYPKTVKFTTHTLRYNKAFWISVVGLGKHWERATVEATMSDDGSRCDVKTENVTAFTIRSQGTQGVRVVLDGKEVEPDAIGPDPATPAYLFVKPDGRRGKGPANSPRKRPGLQGPIDDAFMSSFVFVRPTGQPLNEKVGKWAESEFAHAVDHWRRQFRGEPRVKDDTAVTDADVKEHNLVLFGDPSSNAVTKRIAGKLPVPWSGDAVKIGDKSFDAGHHVPALISPNPLNPTKYVVLNSGFTFREYDYLNNARQVPKLPDYAVIDINPPVTSRAPGRVVEAGFFDEEWKLR